MWLTCYPHSSVASLRDSLLDGAEGRNYGGMRLRRAEKAERIGRELTISTRRRPFHWTIRSVYSSRSGDAVSPDYGQEGE